MEKYPIRNTAVKRGHTPDVPHTQDAPSKKARLSSPRDEEPQIRKSTLPLLPAAAHPTMSIEYITGSDIFLAPPRSVLIHSCNCRGSWGKGIALAFKTRYPSAYQVYRKHCLRNPASKLLGQALLIPPTGKDAEAGKGHYIACLFTSVDSGARKSRKAAILEATGKSMGMLMEELAEVATTKDDGALSEIRMPKINSGLFAVPWEETEGVLVGLKTRASVPTKMFVYEQG